VAESNPPLGVVAIKAGKEADVRADAEEAINRTGKDNCAHFGVGEMPVEGRLNCGEHFPVEGVNRWSCVFNPADTSCSVRLHEYRFCFQSHTSSLSNP